MGVVVYVLRVAGELHLADTKSFIFVQVSQNALEGKPSRIPGVSSDGVQPIPFVDVVHHHLDDEGRESRFESNAQGGFEFAVQKPGRYTVEFCYRGFLSANSKLWARSTGCAR